MSIACFICLENYERSEDIVSINRCGHVYHHQCLEAWKKSQNNLSNCCPTCRTTYTKRSLTRLFLGQSEPDRDFEKDIQKLEEEKRQENQEKTIYMNELIKVKTEYGIKCQAYLIIDNVNNQYLQNNLKLQEENCRLQEEHRKIKEELDCMKNKIVPQPPLPSIPNVIVNEKVDLTYEDISDDDDIEIVSTFLRSKAENLENSNIKVTDGGVIEINDDDDDDDVQVIENGADNVETNAPQNTINDGDNQEHHSIMPLDVAPENNPVDDGSTKPNEEVEQAVIEIQKFLNSNDEDDEGEPEVKKARMSSAPLENGGRCDDFKFLQDFILSQI